VKRFSTYVGYVDRVLLYWEIYAGSDAEKIVEWPESFSSEYSMIDPQEIFHMQSEFFLSGPSLIDMIDETFGGKTKNEDFESYSVTLQ
jgi:hypothetical protein